MQKKRDLKVEIDREKLYDLEEAVELIMKTQSAKFIETLDISMRLGVDPKKAEQQVKGTALLPNGTGIKKKILALVSSENKQIAEEAGADFAGDEYIEKIKNGWLEFDVAVAMPDMMAKIGKIGKILGTKGLMPNVKYGTIDKDIASMVKGFKNGRVIFKTDKFGLVNSPVGKSDFKKADILENIKYLVKEVVQLKPSTSKGQYLRSVALSLTMGPSIKLDPLALQRSL